MPGNHVQHQHIQPADVLEYCHIKINICVMKPYQMPTTMIMIMYCSLFFYQISFCFCA